MSDGSADLGERLRQAFVDASHRRSADVVKSSRQWHELGQLTEGARAEAAAAREQQAATYKGEVETEERRLMHREAAQSYTFEPAGLKQGMLDFAARRLQAHRNVRQSNEAANLGIEARAQEARAAFLRRCRVVNRVRGQARDAFNRGPRR